MSSDKVKKFIDLLIESPNIDNDYIYKLIGDAGLKSAPTAKKSAAAGAPIDTSDYSKLTNVQLKDLCRQKKLKLTGKKEDLINRLNGCVSSDKTMQMFTQKEKKQSELIKSSKGATKKIKKNSNGNYVDEDTMLVFDINNKKVMGKEVNGRIINLTKEDIDYCVENKFDYVAPANLDEIYADIQDENIDTVQVVVTDEPYIDWEEESLISEEDVEMDDE